MSIARYLRATITAAFLALGLIAACSDGSAKFDERLFDVNRPFGLDWSPDEQQVASWVEAARASCIESSSSRFLSVDDQKREDLLGRCETNTPRIVFFPIETMPAALVDGELSVVAEDLSRPARFEFSYLHSVFGLVSPEVLAEEQVLRDQRAHEIREVLIAAYGEPDALGDFHQGSETGFVSSDLPDRPCAFWLEDVVGILLCSRRVVLIDGIEMSLSFVNLRRIPHAEELLAQVMGPDLDDEKYPLSVSLDDLTFEYRTNSSASLGKSLAETVAYWLDSNEFKACEAEDLEPIEEVWSVAEDLANELSYSIDGRSADELALLAIEYAGDLEIDLSPWEREKAVMYLFRQAAEQGSAIAANEIGASLLYCYQHVQQDMPAARLWLEKAAARDDPLAMHSLAKMHLAGLIDVDEPEIRAAELLLRCAELGSEDCVADLEAWERDQGED